MFSTIRVQAIGAVVLSGLAISSFAVQTASPTLAQQAASTKAELQPVETEVHEYMEYVNQPIYKELREAMKDMPQDDAGWAKIKSGSLILSESGNLIMLRGPEKNRQDWLSHAAAVRDVGAEMYRAAKEQNFEQTTTQYRAMLERCNSCHQQFAGGEYQLKP